MQDIRGRVGLFVCMLVVLLGVLVAPAQAAPLTHKYVSASYSGWGYPVAASAGDRTTQAWRWASTGWVSEPIAVGAGVKVYPWTSGWSWAYRNGSWYAIQTARLAEWSCTPASTPLSLWVYQGHSAPAATAGTYSFNSRYTSGGGAPQPIPNDVTRLCSNAFPDASQPAGTTWSGDAWVLVSAEVGQTVTVPAYSCGEFNMSRCTTRWQSWGVRSVYIQAKSLDITSFFPTM